MSKDSKVRLVVGLAVTGLLVGSVATLVGVAQQAPRGRARMVQGGPGRGGAIGPMAAMRFGLRQLDLSEAQRRQIQDIVARHRAEFTVTSEAMVPARRALADAIAADPIDEAAIRAKSAELARLRADVAIKGARLRAEVFKVLTPEQQQKARELKDKARTRLDRARRLLRR